MDDFSLGPLKIANPDAGGDASPDSAMEAASSVRSTSAISPISIPSAHGDYLSHTTSRNTNPSPISPLESPPVNSIQAAAAATPTASANAPQKSSFIGRAKQRESIPYSYQDQQQAQFPQYPTMMPQNLHDPQTNASRPVPTFYTQPPVNGKGNTGGVARENSYRMRSDASRQAAAIPHRSTSRGSAMVLQAGVPTRDNSHSERNYKPTSQYTPGNAPAPPRRASKGVGGILGGSPSNGGIPMTSNTSPSTSPYNIEGGPLPSSEEWKERGAAVSVQQDYDANGKPVSRYIKKGVKDFIFGQTLGEGSYSTVLAATDRQTLKEYAIKVLDKRHIIKEKKVKYVNIEKDTLNRLTDHPGVVRLYYTFQDERSLYFVLDLASGGELLGVLKRMTTFDEECTRFYAAQILDTIEYMHRRGVIHRDLKPENVLLDDKMHVKITDFGTAKILDITKNTNGNADFELDDTLDDNRASSFVGTAEYVSPELLTDKNACKASDLWAFGCIIYQLLAGRPPFKAGNEYQTFQKIVALDYIFPRGFPEVARDLVERLLVLDPQRRLTIEHVKNHQFFTGVIWGKGLWQQKAPRLKSYTPPPAEPIRLGGHASNDPYLPDTAGNHSTLPTILPPVNNGQRPQPRVITELPPPSQLDIEWSPVLTRNNERILKLGNMSVLSMPKPHSPHNGDGGGKFSRLFGGNGAKKRQRLVMVTSSARIILAEAGGNEKKSKVEIPLLQIGCQFSSATDTKGVTHWIVDTRDKQYTFEDPKPSSNDPMASAISTQDWLDTLDRAKELAASQSVQSSYAVDGAYGETDSFNMSSSAISSHASTLDHHTQDTSPSESTSHQGRATLHKQHSGADAESIKGRKRFSKRQSKSGLAAVF